MHKMVHIRCSCVFFIIKELVRLILRSTLFLCLALKPNNATYQFLFCMKREEMPSFFQTILNFLYFLSFRVWECFILQQYRMGKIHSVSIDRTRKNRRGKISSLFLFATDLLMCYFDPLLLTNTVYNGVVTSSRTLSKIKILLDAAMEYSYH